MTEASQSKDDGNNNNHSNYNYANDNQLADAKVLNNNNNSNNNIDGLAGGANGSATAGGARSMATAAAAATNKQLFIAEGEVLRFDRVSRYDMGFYMCIASNGVSPSVSQRIFLPVSCKY